ncbi:melanopsin-B [Hydra vulgaris]|uniref:Melanopsin-B n=1 Tax=Hydra vulgaris TaxID=6087 RepID=A0ABM4C5C6_HYDVU
MDAEQISLTFIALMAIIGNIASLYCLAKRRVNNYIILCINLSVSAEVQSIFGYLPTLFLDKSSIKPTLLCRLAAFFTTFPSFTSITILTAVAISRMFLLEKPFLSNYGCYRPLFYKIGMVSWIYSLVWAALPLLGFSSYTLEATGSRCSINWTPKRVSDKIFLILLVILMFFLPLIIILVSCFYTARVIHLKLTYFSCTYGKDNIETKRFEKKEKKAVLSFLIMILSFLLCWTPYATIGLLSAFTSLTTPSLLLKIAALLAKLSAAINPLIYCTKDNLFYNLTIAFKLRNVSLIIRSRNRENVNNTFTLKPTPAVSCKSKLTE